MVTTTVKNHSGILPAMSVQAASSAEEAEVESLAAAEAKLCIHSCTAPERSGAKRASSADSHSKKSASAGRKTVL